MSRTHQALGRSRSEPRALHETDPITMFEPLEQRLLLSAGFTCQTTESTYVYGGMALPTLKNPGPVSGLKDLSDSVGGAYAHAWTDGTDPGWNTPTTDDDLAARARATASSDGTLPAIAQVTCVLDYVVSLKSLKAWPDYGDLAPLSQFVVPIRMTFRHYVKIEGPVGGSSTVTATSRIEAWSSNLSNHWIDPVEKTTAGEWETRPLVIEVIPYSPQANESGYISVMLSSSAQVSIVQAGTISATIVSDPVIEFDQAGFDQMAAQQGFQTFSLSDYFSLNYGVNTAHMLPVAPMIIASAPDLEAASDTGTSDTDDLTGDVTPTFAGTVTVLPGARAAAQAILYVDGVEAGRGPVTNGAYRITSSLLPPGAHNVTAAAGYSNTQMGPQSEALPITVDTSLPAGQSLDVTLGAGGAKAVTFTDVDGTTATLRLTAGTATITFEGTNLSAVTNAAGTKITGFGPEISQVALSGDTSKGALSFTLVNGKGSNGQIDIGGITSTGPVKSITGANVNLWGDVTINGSLGGLTLGDVRMGQRAITLGGAATDKPLPIVLDDVNDLSLTSGAPISSLTVARWADSRADDQLTAPALLKLTSGGVFAPSLDLSGAGVAAGKSTLGITSAKGRLTGETWTIHGRADSITTAGIPATWGAVIDGAVKSLSVKGNMAGSLQALSIGTLSVTGDLDGALIALSQPVAAGVNPPKALGTMTVTGTMNNSSLTSEGSITAITVGRLTDSTIFAGVDTLRNAAGVVPDEAADFDAQAGLDRFTVKGIRGQAVSMQGSVVAAYTLGTVSVLDLPTGGLATGGLAARKLVTSYTRKVGLKTAFTYRGPLTGPAALEQADGYIARLV